MNLVSTAVPAPTCAAFPEPALATCSSLPAAHDLPAPAKKVCPRCGHDRPKADFRGRWCCFRCWRLYIADYRRRRRSRQLDRFAAACAKPENDRRIPAIIMAMFRSFDSVDAFVKTWRAEFDAAREKAPGSRRVLNYLRAMLQLVLWCEERQRQEIDEMSRDELNELQTQAVLETIDQHPEIAIVAARSLGWTVVPPEAPAP